MKKPFKRTRGSPEPSPTKPSLAVCLAERCATHQGFARVRPTVRVRPLLVVLLQPPLQTLRELGHRMKVSPLQQLARQDAEEQFHLIQPRAVDRRKVENHLVAWVTQE